MSQIVLITVTHRQTKRVVQDLLQAENHFTDAQCPCGKLNFVHERKSFQDDLRTTLEEHIKRLHPNDSVIVQTTHLESTDRRSAEVFCMTPIK